MIAWAIYLFYSLFPVGYTTFDGVLYTHIAKNILLDGQLGWQATFTNPFYSVLIAAVYPFCGDLLLSSIIVSKLMSCFLALSVYLLVRDLFGERSALISSILVVSHPHIIFLSKFPEPEITYMAILYFSFWCCWRAYKRRSFSWAVAGSAFAAMSYLTRSEGLFVFFLVITSLCLLTLWNRKVNKQEQDKTNSYNHKNTQKHILIIAVTALSFLILATPYMLFLKHNYGRYLWSPKSTNIAMTLKLDIMGKSPARNEIFPLLDYLSLFSTSFYNGSPELWGITDDGKLTYQNPKKIDNAMGYIKAEPLKFAAKYFSNLSKQLPGRMSNSSGQETYPQPYPWYYFGPALLFILYSLYTKRAFSKTLFLSSPLGILLLIPAFTGGWWKYLTPYTPIFIIFAVRFFELVSDYLDKKRIVALFASLVVIYSLWSVSARATVPESHRAKMKLMLIQERERAGLWAQKQYKNNPVYMLQWNKLAYYLGGRWIPMPLARYDQIIAFAKKNKVEYLVFEARGEKEKWAISRFLNNQDLIPAGIYQGEKLTNYYTLFYKLRRNEP